jgi:hypothetical protein
MHLIKLRAGSRWAGCNKLVASVAYQIKFIFSPLTYCSPPHKISARHITLYAFRRLWVDEPRAGFYEFFCSPPHVPAIFPAAAAISKVLFQAPAGEFTQTGACRARRALGGIFPTRLARGLLTETDLWLCLLSHLLLRLFACSCVEIEINCVWRHVNHQILWSKSCHGWICQWWWIWIKNWFWQRVM